MQETAPALFVSAGLDGVAYAFEPEVRNFFERRKIF